MMLKLVLRISQVYEIVDNTIKSETPVEVRDAVNEHNPITKKVCDLDIQRIDNDYGPVLLFLS